MAHNSCHILISDGFPRFLGYTLLINVMYRLENDFFTYSNIFLLTHLFMPSMEKINRIKTLLTIKVPEGITFVAGYFFLTMLVKLVLTTIVSHTSIGKTTSM